MGGIKSLASQTLIYGAGTIVPRLLNYALLTPFYIRVFPKGEYGSYTVLYVYVAFLMTFLTYGMETTFFRFASTEKHKGKVFSTAAISLLTTASLFLIWVTLFKQGIASFIDYQHNANYILLVAGIVVLDAVASIPFAYLREENRAVKFMLIKILNVLVTLVFNYFFLYLCKGAYEAQTDSFLASFYSPEISVGYVLISNLIASAIVFVVLLPEYRALRWGFDFTLWKRMIKYALPLLLVSLAAMVNEMADKLFLKYLIQPEAIGLEQVGIYGANYKIAILMTLFIQMFKYAAEPFFFSQSKQADAKQTYSSVMNYFIIFGMAIFLFINLFLPWIKYFIDKPYYEGLKIVPIVVLANLFLGIYYNLSIWYKLTSKTYFGAYMSVGGALITIGINYLLVPYYGYLASAWITFSVYGLMMIVSWFLGQKHYKINYPLKKIALYFILGLSLYQLNVWLNMEQTLAKFLVSSFLFLSFLAVAITIERRNLKTIIQQ